RRWSLIAAPLARLVGDLDPRRGVIARPRLIADPAIDIRVDEARREHSVQQQMIDAQPRVALPVVAEVLPERVDPLVRMDGGERIDPTLREQPPVRPARL